MKFPKFFTPQGWRSLCVLMLSLAVIVSAPPPATAQSLGMERERCRIMLRDIKNDIKEKYYDSTFRGIDIETRFKTADEKLKQANSVGQMFAIIAQVLVDFDDSHTIFLPPGRAARVEYGWRMQMIGDNCYVVAIKPGSDAEKKGLKVGDLLLEANGFQIDRDNLWKFQYLFYTLKPQPGIRVVVQSPGGQPRQLDLLAKIEQGKRVKNLTTSGTGSDIFDLIREGETQERLDRHRYQESVGELFIWKMPQFDLEESKVDEIMDKVKKHKTLILDLRGNPGGYILTLERLASHFFESDLKIADRKGRKEMKPMLAKRRGTPYTGKVIVLVDSRSASAAELFARLMQLEKRGTVIGDRTAGAVMQSRLHDYKQGTGTVIFYAASITDADVIMSDGKSLEKVGVTPDELRLPTAEDMAAGHDPLLAYAASLAGVKLDPVKAGTLFPIEWRP